MMNNTTNYENNSKNATKEEVISLFYNGNISSIVINDTTKEGL